jgi:ATP-dependent Clp protease ATP-binding subunit ClpC
MDEEARTLKVDEPRLRMSVAGRLLVRIISWVMYLVLIATTISLLISSLTRLRLVGAFLALMVLDLMVHRDDGDVTIPTLSKSKTGEVNAAKALRPSALTIIERAYDTSVITRHDFYLELGRRLIGLPEIEEGLRRLDVPVKDFKDKLAELEEESVMKEESGRAVRAFNRDQVTWLVTAAMHEAIAAGHQYIEASDLFSALAQSEREDDAIGRLCNLFSIPAGDLARAMIFSSNAHLHGFGRLPSMLGGFILGSHHRVRHRIMNRAWTSRPTPLLDRFGVDFTDLARDGQIGFLIGHSEEYKELIETLARPTDPNALLVGEPGIGKEALIQHLAFRLQKDDVPRSLFDKRLVSLELNSLVAGATPEELNERLKTIVAEITIAGNIIVYIPDIHNLVKTSGTAYLSAADALMPVIRNNMFPIVGATYPKEFKQYIESRTDFAGAFEVIRMHEITQAEAEEIITYESMILEKESKIIISFGAVKNSVSLAKKYFHDTFLPSSAETLLKSALVEAERRGDKRLGPELVISVAEQKSHIPIHEASGAESETLLHLEDIIHERYVDQEEAVAGIATALREYRSGLARKGGPIASFLFVGPTGVGKTELAKIVADIQFGSEKMMTRFDMTEYQDKASFIRFIGSPDGETRGALTDAVIEKPYSLILLDEFEKAYPDILNLFLQVLDDGRLTDSLGRVVDFTNTIIIATSNAHSDLINESLSKGESMADIGEYIKKRLVDVFKPELINRFSKIVVFKNLGTKELASIVGLHLAELSATAKVHGIHLTFDEAAVAEIAKRGYDPAFGARPLRRVIEEVIRAPLASEMLTKRIAKGSRVEVVFKDSQFIFEPRA